MRRNYKLLLTFLAALVALNSFTLGVGRAFELPDFFKSPSWANKPFILLSKDIDKGNCSGDVRVFDKSTDDLGADNIGINYSPDSDRDTSSFNDEASCIYVGVSGSWKVCADPQGDGRCVIIKTINQPVLLNGELIDTLGRKFSGFEDKISSIYKADSDLSGPTITLYEDKKCNNPAEGCNNPGDPKQKKMEAKFDDTINGFTKDLEPLKGDVSSIKISGGTWKICQGVSQEGTCTIINTDISDLNEFKNYKGDTIKGFDDKISSLSKVSDETTRGGAPADDNEITRGSAPGAFQIKNPLQADTIPQILKDVGDFLFKIAFPIVVIMVLFAGFQILTAAGNPEQIDRGKKTLLWAILGTVIILIAGGVANLIADILGGG